MSSNTKQRIVECLAVLESSLCQIDDCSHQHSRGADSHFAITLVSDQFTDTSRLQRQQIVNRLLLPLLHNPVHSWTLELYSPSQWQDKPIAREIPQCQSSS